MTTVKLDTATLEYQYPKPGEVRNEDMVTKNAPSTGSNEQPEIKPLGESEIAYLNTKILQGDAEKLGEQTNSRHTVAIYKIDGVTYFQTRELESGKVEYYPKEPYSFDVQRVNRGTEQNIPSNQNDGGMNLFNNAPTGILVKEIA